MKSPLRLLLLGGTEEGRILAQRLQQYPGLETIHSLAGRTRSANGFAGRLRRGGFGGASGLARYLRANGIDLLLDATHPHAARISRNAAFAARQCGIPRAQLCRPPWTPQAGDRWRNFDSLESLARALPAGARVFLTLGSGGLEAFARRARAEGKNLFFLLRCIESPRFADGLDFPAHFPNAHLLLARGPFHLDEECALMRDWRVDILVSKNSGGAATGAKLTAARRLDIPVWMLSPPPALPGLRLRTIEEAQTWVRRAL